uniref:PHD and ring finger domains 1 n=1 Tax=Gasterosteus aculeatus aculeatus TaxID=481459 RepID=A0AAQ4PIT8_GASAC
MDEDDSQDELINRSASHSKGKRTALWDISGSPCNTSPAGPRSSLWQLAQVSGNAIPSGRSQAFPETAVVCATDDSDSGEEESEEGESDSGEEEEEEEEGHRDGEDDEEDDDEEEEDEVEDDGVEEGDTKAEDGASGGIPIDLAEMSSDEDAEKCPICLNSFSSQPVATPESCEHYFCLDCILAWAKNANSCPVDRIAFNSIYLRKCYGGKVEKMITVQKPVKEGLEEVIDVDLEQTRCEVCRGSDHEDRLLLCDGCDAGYHMECLTPPLDSVPVEEWFCPGCEATDDVSDAESLPSTARPATSRPQSAAAGPTRAIARTQQSERVRANVNRHRITQARSSQLAPTYLIQSNWLDDTINAVVSGLNTAVYIRDLTPRVPSISRRKTGMRKTSSATGKSGTGVHRRRRKMRSTKSRKNLMLQKAATPRGRIASNLRIVKDTKNSSLPTVYRPSEQTLSSMRADIGAASLSIYGDPFDLDPFVDRDGEGQQARVTTLLEAKRRGISRSALRSHQPVARPVTAGVSSRGMNIHQSGGDVEVSPVPDLLSSILSGQSVLLMDSSDVVINRDGTLKAINPSKCVCLCVCVFQETPAPSSSSSRLPPQMPCSASHIHPPSHSDLPPRGHPRLQPPRPLGPTRPPGHWRNVGVEEPDPSFSIHPALSSASKSKGGALSRSQPQKATTKPAWVDVSVLPRIPKIKRESSNGSNSASGSNGYRVPEMGITSFARDKGRQQSVNRQKGRPDGSGSSSTFSNSFSSSSSSSWSPGGSFASHPRYSLPSSSSSAVSFRINSSGNSWQSRQLSSSSSAADEAKRRQMHRDKNMLLASLVLGSKEPDSETIYDPFDPTLSDSSSSGGEAESAALEVHAHHPALQGSLPVWPIKRSGSSSSSKERSRKKKPKQKSKESSDDRERDCDRRRVSTDKRRGRSRSRSQEKKHVRSCSRSRSRSRERRKDHTQLQPSSLSSRDKESQSRERKGHGSRSSSREKKKEGSPKEEPDARRPTAAKSVDEEGSREDPIKTEMFEIKTETCEAPFVKSEPGSPELCYFTSSPAPTTADAPREAPAAASHAESTAPVGQPGASRLSLPVKQEVLHPSDDYDFNVDVMLDNLVRVKSECAGESAACVKQKREVGEEKKEPVSAAGGAKAKAQVKRVTWNIQEPEGPQPQKSASKLSLYKLKLKQEGARRPSSTVQTSGQVGRSPALSRRRPNIPYLKKLHMQERAVEEVKLAIKPFYQRRDIDKDEYKEILRKAVQKVCHSKSGEINPVKVGNLVKAYVDKYKHARKRRKGEDSGQAQEAEDGRTSDSP